MKRDAENDKKLNAMGWQSMHFWFNDLKKYFDGCVNDILDAVLQKKLNDI